MNGASTASSSAMEMLRANSGMRVRAKKNAASPKVVNSGTMPKNSTMWLGVSEVSRTTTWCHAASVAPKTMEIVWVMVIVTSMAKNRK